MAEDDTCNCTLHTEAKRIIEETEEVPFWDKSINWLTRKGKMYANCETLRNELPKQCTKEECVYHISNAF